MASKEPQRRARPAIGARSSGGCLESKTRGTKEGDGSGYALLASAIDDVERKRHRRKPFDDKYIRLCLSSIHEASLASSCPDHPLNKSDPGGIPLSMWLKVCRGERQSIVVKLQVLECTVGGGWVRAGVTLSMALYVIHLLTRPRVACIDVSAGAGWP